jgi:hypothetical protein
MDLMSFVNSLDALVDAALIIKTKILVYEAIKEQFILPN